MERTGGCLCGAVRFVATLKDDELGVCHCGMCRKWAGGPFVTASSEQVTWEDDSHVATFTSSQWAERGFCDTCGSTLFYRLTAGGSKGRTIIAAGSLDDLDGLRLTREIFTDKKPEGYCFAGDISGMTEAEVFAKYSGGS